MAEDPELKASSARMYDYYLGGYHNLPVDREAAEAVIATNPDAALIMRANRAFLQRAVRFLLEQGIDQFLDLGSGIPTVGNVHEIAHQHNPAARVVYVDRDPVAVAQSTYILGGDPRVAAIQEDVRHLPAILGRSDTKRLLDLNRPLAILIVSVLLFITDDAEAAAVARAARAALAPGGYLVISHGSSDGMPSERMQPMLSRYNALTNPVRLRSRQEVTSYFDGLELVPPGVVQLPAWRPDGPDDLLADEPVRANSWGGVGRKPSPARQD